MSLPPDGSRPARPGVPPHRPPPPRPPRDFAAEEQFQRDLTNVQILIRRGSFSEAEAALQKLSASRPHHAGIRESVGDLRAAQGNWDAAIAAWKEAVKLEPARATAEAKLARGVLRQGEEQRLSEYGVRYMGEDTGLSSVGGAGRFAAWESALIPGLGQFVLGQYIKAALIAVIYFGSCWAVATLSAHGAAHTPGYHPPGNGSSLSWLFGLVAFATWIYAISDAIQSVRNAQ